MLEMKAFIGLNDEKHGSEVVIAQENPLGVLSVLICTYQTTSTTR